jgi:hypothetical protein
MVKSDGRLVQIIREGGVEMIRITAIKKTVKISLWEGRDPH